MTLLGIKNPVWLGSQVAEFSPLDISNLELWLDASDAATITKDGGNLVSDWDDKSGQGNDVAQATGTNQPLWVDSVQNSMPIIRFDGVDNYMNRASLTGGDASQPNTIVIVVKWISGDDKGILDGVSGKRNYLTKTSGLYNIFAGTANTGTTVNSADILMYYAEFNSTSSFLRRSKSQLFTGDSGTNAIGGIHLGSNFTPVAFGDPDIAEILIYNKALTTGERDSVETYMTDKWAV